MRFQNHSFGPTYENRKIRFNSMERKVLTVFGKQQWSNFDFDIISNRISARSGF